jgi:hypothetical protein
MMDGIHQVIEAIERLNRRKYQIMKGALVQKIKQKWMPIEIHQTEGGTAAGM